MKCTLVEEPEHPSKKDAKEKWIIVLVTPDREYFFCLDIHDHELVY